MRKNPENNLRKIRLERGLTLEQLAERVEPQTSADNISKLELGERGLDHQWMIRLGHALQCDPRDFIGPRNKKEVSDAEVALAYAIQILMQILFKNKPGLKLQLRSKLIDGQNLFRREHLPDAERVIEQLLACAEGQELPGSPRTTHKLSLLSRFV